MIQLWTRLSLSLLVVCGPTLILGDTTITVNKATWDFNYGVDQEIPGVKTVDNCKELCLDDPENCYGYTHMTVGLIGYCYKFAELTSMHACEKCSSGTSPQILEGSACTFNKEIKLGEESVKTVEECWQTCYNTTDCLSFTYHNASSKQQNVCDLFSKQCTNASPCKDCLSGHVNRLAAPAQCYEYYIMDEESRNSHAFYSSGVRFGDILDDQRKSPRWVGPNYYRMMGPAGTRIPERVIPQEYCLTSYPGHLPEGSHPTEVGVEVERVVSFTGSTISRGITITLCPDGYYVYHLPRPYLKYYRYCAE